MGTNEKEPKWIQEVKRIGGVAGAVSAILALFFLFFPKLNPSLERSVTLKELQVQPNPSQQTLAVRFKAEVAGHQGETLPIIWRLYDSTTGAAAMYSRAADEAPQLGDMSAKGTSQLKPNARKQLLPVDIYIPSDLSWKGHTWRIEIELYDARGNKLDKIGTNFEILRSGN
jgi:hypothetical protein